MGAVANCNIPTGDDVAVDDWVLAIDDCLKNFQVDEEAKYWTKACIYRVPDFIREVKKKAFTPQVVSLGPFHNGAEALMPVEEHKRRALISFLRRSRKPLSVFMHAVHEIAPKLQDCYHNLDKKWSDVKKFTRLMVLDGCFVLETIRTGNTSEMDIWKTEGTYAPRDPVFSVHGVHHRVPYIMRDMLVLENQIPLELLKVLLKVEGIVKDVDDKCVNDMILTFFGKKPKEVEIDRVALHPLDLYRRSMVQGAEEKDSMVKHSFKIIRSATELSEAGISFKKSNGSCALTNINFEKGVLYLPFMEIDDVTEFWLLNMIAFEQIHVGCSSKVTAYVSFMDELIDTPKDVNLLESKGIIRNAHGSSESVANLFNGLSTEVTLTPGWGLENVRSLVDKHCQKKWNKHKASLRHTYFKSPWSLISLIGAILVIILTASQTAYAILQYYHPNGSGAPTSSPSGHLSP